MRLDDAMLAMKAHEGSTAFACMLEMLEAARQDAMEQMLDSSGDELLELKGVAYGLRQLIEDMLRSSHESEDNDNHPSG